MQIKGNLQNLCLLALAYKISSVNAPLQLTGKWFNSGSEQKLIFFFTPLLVHYM